MATHTPGPWMVAPCSDGDEIRNVVADYSERIDGGLTIRVARWIAELDASLDFDSDVERQLAEMDANARLIAAAPDLLDALKAMVASYDGLRDALTCTTVIAKLAAADAAIVKAEGK